MGIYEKYLLPHFIHFACGVEPIMRQREKVVPDASGTVLEVGVGTGHNLRYYDGERVERVIGLDPSERSWEIARRRNPATPFELEFIGLPGEEIPLEDSSVDTVVITFSLCTIPDPVTALRGMHRVLKPGGRLLFAEHGRAPDEEVQVWQDRITPTWRKLAGGCHLNRDIPSLLASGGFDIRELDTMYLPKTPRFAGFNYWGTAVPD